MRILAEIRSVATNIRPYKGRYGCYRMKSVALCCVTEKYDNITKGEIVHAIAFDTVGMYPNCVQLKGKDLWFWADNFNIV